MEMQETSIFNNLQSQIPSIDYDLLSSSNEEDEISVYQRPSLTTLHSLEWTDLDLSLDEPEIEDLLKSVTQPFIGRPNEDLSSKNDEITPKLPAKQEQHPVEVASGAEVEKTTTNSTRSHTSETVHGPKFLKGKLTIGHQKNRNPNIDSEAASEQNILTEYRKPENNMSQTAVNICESQSLKNMEHIDIQPYPFLSLKHLENLDLHNVLQSLKKHGYKHITEEERQVIIQPLTNSGDGEKRENKIMEQLAAFSRKQLCNETETQTVSSNMKRCQRPYEKNDSTTRQTPLLPNDFKAVDEKSLYFKNEVPPTVFIDLRNTDNQTKATVIHNWTSNSAHARLTKPVLFNEGLEVAQTEAAPNTRKLTGKSLLLQKRREANRTRAEHIFGETVKSVAKPEKEETSRVHEDCQGRVNSAPF